MGKKSDLAVIRASMKNFESKLRAVPIDRGPEVLRAEYLRRTPRTGFGDHEACALSHYLTTKLGYEVFRFTDSDQDEGIVSHETKQMGIKQDWPSVMFRSLLHESSHILTQGKWETMSYKQLADLSGIDLPKQYEHHRISFEDEVVAETVAVVVGDIFKQSYADSCAWFLAPQVRCLNKGGRLIQCLDTFGGVEVVESTAIELAEGIREGLHWLHTEGPLKGSV